MNYINRYSLWVIIILTFVSFANAQNVTYFKKLLEERNYEEIIRSIEVELKKYPQNCELNSIKTEAYCYYYRKDTADKFLLEAYKSFEVVKSNKECIYNNINTYNNLFLLVYRKAGIYMNNELYNDALYWFKLAINIQSAINKSDLLIFFYAGLAAYHTGDYSFMEKCFKILVDARFNLKAPYEILLSYYNEKNMYTQLLNIFEQIVQQKIIIDEDLVNTTVLKASNNKDCLFLNKYAENILTTYNSTYSSIANFYYRCNDTIRAINIYKSILQKNQNDTIALVQLGFIHYNAGIFYLYKAKEVIRNNEKEIELYRKLKENYIEQIKLSISYLENSLQNNVRSSAAIKCLYEGYKNLQRKEEMNKLKQQYSYLN